LPSAGFVIESTVQEFRESVEILFASFPETFGELCSIGGFSRVSELPAIDGSIAGLAAQYGGGGSLEKRVSLPFNAS